jgi:hypothetical protein
MRIEERESAGTTGTSDQILSEIRDFCRAMQTAESTFGRLVVNDGKLVSRLRDGAKITTGTLDKVRTYLSEHRATPPSPQVSAAKIANGAPVATDIAPPGFRFFDNRQKYLLFVSTCSGRRRTEIFRDRHGYGYGSRRPRRGRRNSPASMAVPLTLFHSAGLHVSCFHGAME